MISKEKQKFIRNLHKKSNRIDLGLFLVEGEKSILELLNSDIKIKNLYLSEKFINKNNDNLKDIEYISSDEKTIEKLSTIKSNNSGIAIAITPKNKELEIEKNDITIILDTINDPGNLGTIIRICDWYGIKNIIASKQTVEFTNPKVISSTMGSISRINITYTDLENYLSNKNDDLDVYGAFLEGENIHKIKNEKNIGKYIIIGNESNGISNEVEKFVTKKITIPSFGGAESLNAGVACGIIIDNFKRQKKP